MQKEYTIVGEEFPYELAHAIKLLLNLSVSDSTIEKVAEEAISNEILYRFMDMEDNLCTRATIIGLIEAWVTIIFNISGVNLDIDIWN